MFFEFLCLLGGSAYLIGKGLSASTEKPNTDFQMKRRGFNRERQHQLERMQYNVDPEIRREFDRMVRRTCKRADHFDCVLAVRELSIREGWKYFHIPEAYSHPEFVRSTGGKWDGMVEPGQYYGKDVCGEERAKEMIAEADRREIWLERYPDAKEFDMLPMDFKSEEDFVEWLEYYHAKKKQDELYEKWERDHIERVKKKREERLKLEQEKEE